MAGKSNLYKNETKCENVIFKFFIFFLYIEFLYTSPLQEKNKDLSCLFYLIFLF